MTEEERLNNRIQKIADLIVDIVWTDSQDDILQCSEKASTVKVGRVDPVVMESINYGSR